jgi:hypothetical protein
MKNNVTDALNDIFDVDGELVETKSQNVIKNENNPVSPNLTDDFDTARTNIHDIIYKASSALDYMIELAKASEHPRAFEVVSQLTKTLIDANKDLLDIQKKMKELTAEDKPQNPQNVTNALFVGSTAELQKLLKNGNSEDADV